MADLNDTAGVQLIVQSTGAPEVHLLSGAGDEGEATQVIQTESTGENGILNGDGEGGAGAGAGVKDGVGEDSVSAMEEEDPNKYDPKWRSGFPTTAAKLGYALEHRQLFHDAIFYIGEDKEEITGHKAILAICSPVFEELFFGEAEAEQGSGGAGAGAGATDEVYAFADQEPSAFRAMLKFLYTSQFEVTLWNAIGVMRAARRFEVPELLAKTGEFLKANLTEKNAITFYQAAQLFQEKILSESAFEFLLNNFWAVAKSDDFLNITYSNLCKFLDQDEINISELDFFNAVLRWSKHECERQALQDTSENLRSVLHDALALVRFTLMSPKEFALQVVPKFILSPIEVITIFQHLSVELEERDGLPEVFCKSESRKTVRLSNPNLLVQNLKSTRLRVRVRPCDRFIAPAAAPAPAPAATPTTLTPRKRPSYHFD